MSPRHSPDKEQRIRDRAYLLWIEEGRPEAREHAHWEMACALVEAEDAPSPAPRAAPEPQRDKIVAMPVKKKPPAKRSKA